MPCPSIRRILISAVIALLPGMLFAADGGSAMLYSEGTTWVNGNSIPKSCAIFSGDLVQTKSDSIANINAAGSSIIVLPDSLIQFQGSSLKLDHGAVSVATSKGMEMSAGGVKVGPASSEWTEFDVKDSDGTIQIVARKADLVLQDDAGSSTLPQGQQATRGASELDTGKKRKKAGATPAAVGPITNSTAVYVGGAVLGGGLTTWVLIQDDDPISPSKPKKRRCNNPCR